MKNQPCSICSGAACRDGTRTLGSSGIAQGATIPL